MADKQQFHFFADDKDIIPGVVKSVEVEFTVNQMVELLLSAYPNFTADVIIETMCRDETGISLKVAEWLKENKDDL